MDDEIDPEATRRAPRPEQTPPRPTGPTAEDPVPGVSLGRVLGRGASAVVYRGRQRLLDRDVAVKLLNVDLSSPPVARRFEAECRTLGRLSGHPAIVDVLAAGVTPAGQGFVVMPYYRNGTLADRLGPHGLAHPVVLAAAARLCSALAFSHRNGVIHRDIKPENVLLDDDGEAYLSDFGVAAMDDAEHRTRSVAFSRDHVAPEVLRDNDYGVASDIFSLGSTLFTLLTGSPPYRSRNELLQLAAVTGTPFPAHRLTGVPAALVGALRTAMDPEPGRRFRTMEDLGRALAAVPADGDAPTGTGGSLLREPPGRPAAAPVPAAGPAPSAGPQPPTPRTRPPQTLPPQAFPPQALPPQAFPSPAPPPQVTPPHLLPPPVLPPPALPPHGAPARIDPEHAGAVDLDPPTLRAPTPGIPFPAATPGIPFPAAPAASGPTPDAGWAPSPATGTPRAGTARTGTPRTGPPPVGPRPAGPAPGGPPPRRPLATVAGGTAIVVVVAAGAFAWSRTRFSLDEHAGEVVLRNGVAATVAGIDLFATEPTGLRLADLSPPDRELVRSHHRSAGTRDAHALVTDLWRRSERCRHTLADPRCPAPTLLLPRVTATVAGQPRGNRVTLTWTGTEPRAGATTTLSVDGGLPPSGCPAVLTGPGSCSFTGGWQQTYRVQVRVDGPHAQLPAPHSTSVTTGPRPR